MGSWIILIRGHGAHHNGLQDDADEMAEVFVGELRAAGHEVKHGEMVTTGMGSDLLANVPSVASEL